MENELDEIDKKIWDALGNIETPELSNEMKTRFYAMLDTFKNEAEEKKQSSWSIFVERLKAIFQYKPAYNWAYALVLLILGGGIGYFAGKPSNTVSSADKIEKLSNEVQEMRQMMMLSMLENPAATERMKAVSYTQELKTVDDQIIDALLTTLNLDPNENVRIVTVEALVELADNPKVREGLVQSLMKQESPLVQVALADAMLKLQEKRSIKEFKQMLNKGTLDSTVKQKIQKTIKALA